MSPELLGLLYAAGALLRRLAQADAFPYVVVAIVVSWTLARQRDYAPRSLGKVLLSGALAYLVAIGIQYLAVQG